VVASAILAWLGPRNTVTFARAPKLLRLTLTTLPRGATGGESEIRGLYASTVLRFPDPPWLRVVELST
jgi:hypothetical protein